MLNLRRLQSFKTGGFTLIELMVAIVIGMIVVAGAVTLIVSINKANSQTIQATRINQELRALAGVISDEIKRSRRLHDPISYVGQGTTATGLFDSVDTSTAGCIVYGFQDPDLNDPASNAAAVNNYRAISLQTTAGIGSILFISDTSAVTCTTGANITTLNSPQVNITGLTFSCPSGTSTTCNEIDLTISGQLTTGDKGDTSGWNSITRTYTQPIFIRSGPVG